VGEEIDQMEVLEEERPILANALRGLGVHDRTAIASGVDGRVTVFLDHGCSCFGSGVLLGVCPWGR
jgi:hypothetical protein